MTLEIARHFLGRIGKRFLHLEAHHAVKLGGVDRRQTQTLGEDRVHREPENNVIAVVEQAGGLVQVGDVSHFPGAIAFAGTDHDSNRGRKAL